MKLLFLFPTVTVHRAQKAGFALLLLGLLGCGGVYTQGPSTPTLQDHYANFRSEVSNYEHRVKTWNNQVEVLTQEGQIISAHPALPKITRVIQEESARALVQGQTPDILGAMNKINPSVEDFQLLAKLASIVERAKALQQQGESLEAERRYLETKQRALGAMAERQQRLVMEQERSRQQLQTLFLYSLMNRQ